MVGIGFAVDGTGACLVLSVTSDSSFFSLLAGTTPTYIPNRHIPSSALQAYSTDSACSNSTNP